MVEITLAVAVVVLIVLLRVLRRLVLLERDFRDPGVVLGPVLEQKHREMLKDLHEGFTQQGDRLGRNLADSSERLSVKIDQRLDQIAGKVDLRLDEGFKKTNETFVNVMQRLATIDEAQKKIESLTGSVVSLQELLGDKRSRGAFGEVQLEALVRNVLPPMAFELQYTLSNGMRVDCALRLPPPTGLVTVDSKFPLENYHRMFDREAAQAERAQAQPHHQGRAGQARRGFPAVRRAHEEARRPYPPGAPGRRGRAGLQPQDLAALPADRGGGNRGEAPGQRGAAGARQEVIEGMKCPRRLRSPAPNPASKRSATSSHPP